MYDFRSGPHSKKCFVNERQFNIVYCKNEKKRFIEKKISDYLTYSNLLRCYLKNHGGNSSIE